MRGGAPKARCLPTPHGVRLALFLNGAKNYVQVRALDPAFGGTDMELFRLGGAALLAGSFVWCVPAAADDDDFKTLMADCGRADLASSDISECLERARVMDDTRPSPDLERLLTQLERRLEDASDAAEAGKPSGSAVTGGPRTLQGAPAAKTVNPSYAVSANAPAPKPAASQSFLGSAWQSISNLADDLDPGARSPSDDPLPVEVAAPEAASAPPEREGVATTPPREGAHN